MDENLVVSDTPQEDKLRCRNMSQRIALRLFVQCLQMLYDSIFTLLQCTIWLDLINKCPRVFHVNNSGVLKLPGQIQAWTPDSKVALDVVESGQGEVNKNKKPKWNVTMFA